LILGSYGWQSTKGQEIWEIIEAQEPDSHYSLDSEFKFFGKKLWALQKYVSRQSGYSFRALWVDRKDMKYWWALWVCDISDNANAGILSANYV